MVEVQAVGLRYVEKDFLADGRKDCKRKALQYLAALKSARSASEFWAAPPADKPDFPDRKPGRGCQNRNLNRAPRKGPVIKPAGVEQTGSVGY